MATDENEGKANPSSGDNSGSEMVSQLQEDIHQVNISDEMEEAYLNYSMSVLIGRALPDARDGFKPVHRRVLYAMWRLGNRHDVPYKKSARVVIPRSMTRSSVWRSLSRSAIRSLTVTATSARLTATLRLPCVTRKSV